MICSNIFLFPIYSNVALFSLHLLVDNTLKSPNQWNEYGDQMHRQLTFTPSWPYQWMPNYYTPVPICHPHTPPTMPVNIHHESYSYGHLNHATYVPTVHTTQTPSSGMNESEKIDCFEMNSDSLLLFSHRIVNLLSVHPHSFETSNDQKPLHPSYQYM